MEPRDEEIRAADRLIRASGVDFDFHGFVEGDDISKGAVDVIVTDGFTGNIALKTAEGTARLVAGFLREALSGGILAKPFQLAWAELILQESGNRLWR